MINYNRRIFKSKSNSENGEVNNETMFYYFQKGNVVEAKYFGGSIEMGTLIAIVDQDGKLDMRYQHVNTRGELMTGVCHSEPVVLRDGRIRLYEKWKWTTGDCSEGESVIEEVRLD